MARIRSIKPEFWKDRKLARELDREQRLAYIALWNEADDEGRFEASTRSLLGAIFPHDEDLDREWMETLLRKLVETERVVLYEANGERCGHLTKFKKHQRISHPGKGRLPSPPEDIEHPYGWLGRVSGGVSGGSREWPHRATPGAYPGDSGGSLEPLRSVSKKASSRARSREQGAGSREQGSGAF